MIEIQGCTDNRPGNNPDIYGTYTCGQLADEGCLVDNYDPQAGADDGSCRLPDDIIPGEDQPPSEV